MKNGALRFECQTFWLKALVFGRQFLRLWQEKKQLNFRLKMGKRGSCDCWRGIQTSRFFATDVAGKTCEII